MIVWTVIAVVERQVLARDPTQPLTGGPMSIFSGKTTVTRTDIECVGVFANQSEAMLASSRWAEHNPGGRIKVKVATLDQMPAALVPPPPPECIDCGIRISTGIRCPEHERAWFKALREADPDLMLEIEEAKAKAVS
jgi:hypothetical protein